MYTYIVIDDESLMRKGTIKKLQALTDKAVCIGEAADGYQALELIAEKDPDIIITDMKMPEMDGVELLPLLAERFPDKRIIVISGYKDFDYIKYALNANAVDYILKPFGREDIQNAVLHAIEQLEDKAAIAQQIVSMESKSESARYEYDLQMLKNSILGYYNESCDITSDRLNFISQTHDLVLMTLHTSTQLEEASVQNFLSDNGFGDLALYLQNANHHHLGFLILFLPEHSPLLWQDLCRQIIRSLNHMFDALSTQVSYGISQPHHLLSQLNAAFMETVQALNTKQPTVPAKFYFCTGTQNDPVSIVWDKATEFFFRIEAGMKDMADELLNELFVFFGTRNDITLYDCKMYCFWLADQTRLMLSEYLDQVNPESANSSMYHVLNSMFSLDEMKQYYHQFFLNITALFKNQGIYNQDDVIEKMKIYINRHYQNNLTIEFLSSIFYMNRSYCSHLFKERTGTTFVNYLNTIRLKKAKQLLLESDKKMYQIARQCGYDNVKYFFRVFKKYEDLTPEQYRGQQRV